MLKYQGPSLLSMFIVTNPTWNASKVILQLVIVILLGM